MTDERWSDEDDAHLEFYAQGPEHPVKIASALFLVIRDGVFDVERLREFVTPESVEGWGDFSATTAAFREINQPAVASHASPAAGALDVVYVKVLPDVDEAFTVSRPTPMVAAGVFTFVWRPELNGWKIHGFGTYLLPENLPRTSPGVAPTL